MNERQRQDYMEAMGIQPWFPRFVLPGAKPSYNCDWDFEQDPVPEQNARTAVTPEEQPSSQRHPGLTSLAGETTPRSHQPSVPAPLRDTSTRDSSSILSDLGFAKEETQESDNNPSASPESPAAEADEAPALAAPFRLAVIDVNADCLAVTDLPWSGLNQFTSCYERLLRNITKAVHIEADQEMNTGLFHWPLLPDAPPVDRKYAREAVLGYLNHQFGLQRRKTVLLFSRTSCKYLWSHKEGFESCRGLQVRDDSRYLITCSLGEMMSVPELKAENTGPTSNSYLISSPSTTDVPEVIRTA